MNVYLVISVSSWLWFPPHSSWSYHQEGWNKYKYTLFKCLEWVRFINDCERNLLYCIDLIKNTVKTVILWNIITFFSHYFRNHSNMLICCSRNISYCYQYWKHLCSLKGEGGTMLFHAFIVVYTVEELDFHAKREQSFKKLFGRITISVAKI